MELLRRIERAYLALERKDRPHGARAWFARQAGVYPYTVSRWISAERSFSGPPERVLHMLEEKAGLPPCPEERCHESAADCI